MPRPTFAKNLHIVEQVLLFSIFKSNNLHKRLFQFSLSSLITLKSSKYCLKNKNEIKFVLVSPLK